MYKAGFANFLMIFAQRYFYPCWNKIGTNHKTKQNKKQNKKENKKQTNKNKTKQKKTPFWRFSQKCSFQPKIGRFKIDFLWNSLPKKAYFYILYPISFQVIWQKQISQKATKLVGLLGLSHISIQPHLFFFWGFFFSNIILFFSAIRNSFLGAALPWISKPCSKVRSNIRVLRVVLKNGWKLNAAM